MVFGEPRDSGGAILSQTRRTVILGFGRQECGVAADFSSGNTALEHAEIQAEAQRLGRRRRLYRFIATAKTTAVDRFLLPSLLMFERQGSFEQSGSIFS